MKKLILVHLYVGLFVAAGMAASSVTTNGITFTFDKDYTTGTFLDGEPWVIGPVTVTAMTPAYSNGDNGYEVNPGAPSTGLDSELGNFTAPAALPRTFQPGSSVLKVKSRPYDNTNKSYIDQASVLTVLDQEPPANAFRPPYNGTVKPIYTAGDIDWTKLPTLAQLPVNQVTTADAQAVFGGVWVDHQLGSVMDRRIHPCQAIRHVGGSPCAEYGAEMARSITTALLRCTQEGRTDQLVYDCIQVGIDMYYMYKNGMNWPANGGKFMGRKGAVMFAGKLLGVPEMLQVGGQGTNNFQEDGQFYTGKVEALWGKPEPRPGAYSEWINDGTGGKDSRDPEGLVDGGNCAGGTYCEEHCPTGRCAQPTPEVQRTTGKFSISGYQKIVSNITSGVAALVRIMDIETEWDHPAFLQYADRIGTSPWNYHSSYGSTYLVRMHKTYGTTPLAVRDNVKNRPLNKNTVQLYPHPMRDNIQFTITRYCRDGSQTRLNYTITVYDQTGEIVHQTVGANACPERSRRGCSPFQWFGNNNKGNDADPGMYFYRLTTGDNIFTGRIIKVE